MTGGVERSRAQFFSCTNGPQSYGTRGRCVDGSVGDSLRFIARAETLRARDAEYVFTIADSITDQPLGVTGLRHQDPVMGNAQVGT